MISRPTDQSEVMASPVKPTAARTSALTPRPLPARAPMRAPAHACAHFVHALGLALTLGLLLAQFACMHAPDGTSTSPRASFVDGVPAFPNEDAEGELIHFVVEIPAGTNAKWEVDKATGGLHWEEKNGRPRVVQYLAYPGNYGMIPSTSLPYEFGGDGDPLDVLLLGPALERGSLVRARPIGVLRLLDGGERDDKILAVQADGPLSEVRDLASLDAAYGGVRTIIRTWFTNYKGRGKITSDGFGDAKEAMATVREASRYFKDAQPKP